MKTLYSERPTEKKESSHDDIFCLSFQKTNTQIKMRTPFPKLTPAALRLFAVPRPSHCSVPELLSPSTESDRWRAVWFWALASRWTSICPTSGWDWQSWFPREDLRFGLTVDPCCSELKLSLCEVSFDIWDVKRLCVDAGARLLSDKERFREGPW